MPISTGQKQRKRIAYLEALALRQAEVIRRVNPATYDPAMAREIKELTDAAAMIREVQARREK